MKVQYDYLTLVLPFTGQEKETILEEHDGIKVRYLHQDYLTYHLQKIEGVRFQENNFGGFQSFDFNKEIFIIKRKSYEVHFRGKFFLRDTMSLFSKFWEKVLSLGYSPHISRLDICFTGQWDFKHLAASFTRSDFKNLEVDSKKKRGLITYIKAHNVRFEILCYSKTKQLARLKDGEYITRFRERYGKEKDLSRIEVRLHNRYNLEDFTKLLHEDAQSYFERSLILLLPQISGRLKVAPKVMKELRASLKGSLGVAQGNPERSD